MPSHHHPSRKPGKLLAHYYLRLICNLYHDCAQRIRKSSQTPSHALGRQGRSVEPEQCEVVVHTQGQVPVETSVRHGVTPASPEDSTACGTAALPSARRPLRRVFRGEPSNVPLARNFVRRYLDDCRCSAVTAQDILLCTTELATNAVLHSRSGLPGGHFCVEIALCAEWVRVSVEDAGGSWAEHSADDDDEDAEFGRGLHIVSALSADMGITGDASGRKAWFRCQWIVAQDDPPT